MALSHILTALKDPSARLTQHLTLKVAGLSVDPDVVEFTQKEAFNEEYTVDLTIAVSDHTLDGTHFVNKHATFLVEERAWLPYMEAVNPARPVHGIITQWEYVSASRNIATFKVRLEPRVALLDRVRTSRVFRDKTIKEVFYELLVDRKLLWPHDIKLNFVGLEERYEELLMYEESVLAFIKRMCKKLGLFYYYVQAQADEKAYRDSLVIDNRAKGYVRSIDVPVMPYSGFSVGWHEAVLSIVRKRKLMPGSITLRERNYRKPKELLTATAYVDREDKTLFGSIDRSAEHFHSKAEGEALAGVRREEIVSQQVTLSGTANTVGAFAGVVIRPTNGDLPDAKYGFVIFKATTTGTRSKPVMVEFEAAPAHLVWRPEFVPARDWRWMPSAIIATIESANEGSPYADLDEHGRYRLRYHFQPVPGDPGSNSMRVRSMTPSASDQGGFHAPHLPGVEVRVGFTNNDIDRPFIIGRCSTIRTATLSIATTGGIRERYGVRRF
jgi:type VI secretion system secreted protein VgrG